jgi:hypothetical protein
MSAILRSLVNYIQTIDGVDLKPFALQTRSQSTANLVAAAAARTLQMVIVPDDQAAGAASLTVYGPVQATGTTYQVLDDAEEVKFNHAATIAALTVHLPINPYPNQKITMAFKSAVTALTLDASTAAVTTTVQGALTAATAGGFATYRFDATDSVWYRIA